MTTPYGPPSDPLWSARSADAGSRSCPGTGGTTGSPAPINYRANLWALRSVGVRQVLAPCAVGGLRRTWAPAPGGPRPQLVDRTDGRVHTYYDHGAVHVSMAEPYCPTGGRRSWRPADAAGHRSTAAHWW